MESRTMIEKTISTSQLKQKRIIKKKKKESETERTITIIMKIHFSFVNIHKKVPDPNKYEYM